MAASILGNVLLLGCLTVLASLQSVTGRPTGAPIGACSTRLPGHFNPATGSNYLPQASSSPYVVGASVSAYTVGEPITVRILTTDVPGVSLARGFFLQAVDSSDATVGRWIQHPEPVAHTLSCNVPNSAEAADQDTVTHDDTAEKPTDMLFMWMATQNYGPITFYAVVAQQFTTFWVVTTNELPYVEPACFQNQCANGAACSPQANTNGDSYTCVCASGFVGTYCTIKGILVIASATLTAIAGAISERHSLGNFVGPKVKQRATNCTKHTRVV